MEFRDKELPKAVVETDLPFWEKRSGKVRDVYDAGERLLLVATDRISAYDSVLGSPIPLKGRILNKLSLFWFDFLSELVANHVITGDPVAAEPRLEEFAGELEGRATLARKAEVIPIECVVRGYLSGSGWRSYRESGQVCGIELAGGLRESDKLPEPIFTPATKAESGHDENISFERAAGIAGRERAEFLRSKSIEIYRTAADYAAERGIIIADTKFEFGVSGGRVILVDEVLTPDSSRFWPAGDYEPGRAQNSYDKQFVRDYLDEIGWDHSPPAPALPDPVVLRTLDKYAEAYESLTGKRFEF